MDPFFLFQVTRFYRRTLKSITIDGNRLQKGQAKNKELSMEVPFPESFFEHLTDANDRYQCWRKQRDFSVCPNMKSGDFINISEFKKYLYN